MQATIPSQQVAYNYNMDEQQARKKLQRILNDRINKDILFTELKTADGKGMVEAHITWIKQHSKDGWDEQVAADRIAAVEASMAQE
jgi:hypothetical protein